MSLHWDESTDPVPPGHGDTPDEYPVEARCHCGRVLEYGACPVHGYPDKVESKR